MRERLMFMAKAAIAINITIAISPIFFVISILLYFFIYRTEAYHGLVKLYVKMN